MRKMLLSGVLGWLLCGPWPAQGAGSERPLPHPLPSHPGNVFLAGEDVVVPAPAPDEESWRLLDYDGHQLAEARVKDGRLGFGHLGIGHYTIVRADGQHSAPVTIGVLQALSAPTPRSSPIDVDGSMAWYFPENQMESVANLCALAGVNWVRDRMDWGELEPKKGKFAPNTRYDVSARAESAAGLQVLQVHHHTPSWEGANGKRLPVDLRDAYNFHREVARRWRGQVEAFEPWNEADHPFFGAHTGSEMASYQKAAYLGLKAGNPDVIACLNVFAKHRLTTLGDFDDNVVWPYFDTFNLHHYETFEAFPWLYADFRSISAGKPMWVTECSLPVEWVGDPELKEPTDEGLRLQSERVPMIYAASIYEGAKGVFYFVLMSYAENGSQFGLLHTDLTPRPAFVALAALGRLLADAKPSGRLQPKEGVLEGFVFDAKPGGKEEKVLLVWSELEQNLVLSQTPKACFDHLGRTCSVSGNTIKIGHAPRFVILGKDTQLSLLPPPTAPKLLSGEASPLVLQAVMPEKSVLLERSAYRISTAEPVTVPVFLYNFGSTTARGKFSAVLSQPWSAEFPTEAEIAPGERKELTLRLTCLNPSDSRETDVRVTGDFGAAGQPVLALRFLPAPPQ